MKLRRRTRRRLKYVGIGAAVVATLVTVVAVTSYATAPKDYPVVSDKVYAEYLAKQTLAPKEDKSPLKLADVLPKLHAKDQEFVLTVIGDSTGFGPQAWVRQTVQRVADATGRPTSIRDWDSKIGDYGPPQHIGPAGKETLIVWNGSASGQNASYATAHLPAMLPQKSDLVIINHGHNSPVLMNATEHIRGLINAIWRTDSERAAIVVIAQNPRLDAGAKVDADVVAMTKGLPSSYPTISVLDVYSLFTAAGDLAPLLSPDGLHPAAPGYKIWTDAAVKMLGF
ncbi:gdsl-Like Lipase/Acylhydrolase [Arthrobacter sp. Hiyo6]|nr:gdsl-Like Lipase/Acylhydrolase [Arthrobacter sp. Hiyo6]